MLNPNMIGVCDRYETGWKRDKLFVPFVRYHHATQSLRTLHQRTQTQHLTPKHHDKPTLLDYTTDLRTHTPPNVPNLIETSLS